MLLVLPPPVACVFIQLILQITLIKGISFVHQVFVGSAHTSLSLQFSCVYKLVKALPRKSWFLRVPAGAPLLV